MIAGVRFFPPQSFEHEKPHGDQRQDLMVMPAQPIPNLVVGQTRFALAALDRFFDAVCLLRDPGEFLEGRFGRGIRQIGVVLDVPRFLPVADHDQHLLGTDASLLGPGLNAPRQDVHTQRFFVTVTHRDAGPRVSRKLVQPVADLTEGNLPPATHAWGNVSAWSSSISKAN